MARKLEVQIIGDSSSLERAFGRASGASKGFGSSLARAGKMAAFAAGGAAIGGLAVTLRAGAKEWAQHAKVAAQTTAVLKSTGGAANVTAAQVESLAGAMLRKSGVDDETIQTGENMLLTFTSIRNEVGKGNDIFNQASAAILDMDTAMTHGNVTQESLSKTAIQVGKALNDPIKGATALRRVGVQLTEQQQKQIKAFVESGQTMKAQKVILGELTREFGGSAKAMGDTVPGQINKLKESFNNLSGSLFAKLVPALLAVMDGLNRFIAWISSAGSATGKFKDVLEKLGLSSEQAGKVIDAFGQTFAVIKEIVTTTVAVVSAVWDAFGSEIVASIKNNLGFIIATVQNTFRVVKGIFEVFKGLLTGDWSLMWTGIKDIFGGITAQILATLRYFVETIRIAFDTLWKAVTLLTRAAWVGISALLTAAWNALKALATVTFNAIKAVIETAWNAIKTITQTVWTAIGTATTTAWNAIKATVTAAVGAVRAAVTTAMSAAKSAVTSGWSAAQSSTTSAWNAMRSAVSGAVGSIVGIVRGFAAKVVAIIQSLVGAFRSAGSAAVRAFGEGAVSSLTAAYGAVRSVVDKIKSAVSGAAGAVGGAVGGLIPGRQHGGRVKRGWPYVVGEVGPELFVPAISGRIEPRVPAATAMAAGGGVGSGMVVNVTIQGALLGSSVPEVANTIRRELLRTASRNVNLGLA